MASTSTPSNDPYPRHAIMRPPIAITPSLFSPPALRLSATATVDKSAFDRTIKLAAATIRDPKLLATWRKKLQARKELLAEPKVGVIRRVPEPEVAGVVSRLREVHEKEQRGIEEGKRKKFAEPDPESLKCMLMHPDTKHSDPSTFGSALKEGLEKNDLLSVIPFDVHIGYDHWNWNEIVTSILPPELHSEIPHGFNSVGHVAHLNLRDHHLPYRHLIGQILLEKGAPAIRTVINKTDEVGESSEFRTFTYELLAGEDDLNVEASHIGCLFRFNYGRTYWNSKLDSEHRRLVDMFKPGEVVVDVMAGIGPFSVPAAKKGVLVWANDFNPASVGYMRDAAKQNKVGPLLLPFNLDGRKFIPFSARDVLRAHNEEKEVRIPGTRNYRPESKKKNVPDRVIPIPATIGHFVMNLPASAPEFLPSFKGLYHGNETLFEPTTEAKLPFVHVHCFATKQSYAATTLEDPELPYNEILPRFSEQLGFQMRLGKLERKEGGCPDRGGKPVKFKEMGDLEEGELSVWDVRDVAPSKSMYCVSFRLPAAVAFADRGKPR